MRGKVPRWTRCRRSCEPFSLTGAVYFSIDGSTPWVVETPPGSVIAPHVGAGVEHVINYHVVTSGHCWLGLAGGDR